MRAIKTSEIEGSIIAARMCYVLIKTRLGIHSISTTLRDIKAKVIAELMVEAREDYAMAHYRKT